MALRGNPELAAIVRGTEAGPTPEEPEVVIQVGKSEMVQTQEVAV